MEDDVVLIEEEKSMVAMREIARKDGRCLACNFADIWLKGVGINKFILFKNGVTLERSDLMT